MATHMRDKKAKIGDFFKRKRGNHSKGMVRGLLRTPRKGLKGRELKGGRKRTPTDLGSLRKRGLREKQ